MGDDRPVLEGAMARQSYPSLAFEINRIFCEKKGWDLRYEQYQLPKTWFGTLPAYSSSAGQVRAASWVKLLAVQRALELGYEFVVWIDSDCIFYNHDADWDEIMSNFDQPEVLFLSWLDRPFYHDQFCAGFFIVRSDSQVKSLLRSIWNAPSEYSWKHVYEQSALNEALRKWPKSSVILVDEPMFSLEESHQKLLHIASFDHEKRLPSFMAWFEIHGMTPVPQNAKMHVFYDLLVDDWDQRNSGKGLTSLDLVRRTMWGFYQVLRSRAKRLKSIW